MKKKRTIRVSIIVVIVLISSFLIAILRLSKIALSNSVDGIDIAEFAKNRNTTTKSLYASRGTIYDVNGNALAQDVSSYTLIAYLDKNRGNDSNGIARYVVDKEKTAEYLSKKIDTSYDRIMEILSKDASFPFGRLITAFFLALISLLTSRLSFSYKSILDIALDALTFNVDSSLNSATEIPSVLGLVYIFPSLIVEEPCSK